MNQTHKILSYLEQGNEITPLDALYKFGVFRLGARIWELREAGYNIDTKIVTRNGKHFASYRLERTHANTI